MSINSIGSYTIQSGDCLWNIAKNNYKTETGKNATNKEIEQIVDKMVELNNIKNPDLIFAGNELKMPEYDCFEVAIEDDTLEELDETKEDDKSEAKNTNLEAFKNTDVTKIKIKGEKSAPTQNESKTTDEPKTESKTPTSAEKDGTERFTAFADWSSTVALKAAAAGETAGGKISDVTLSNEEYQKQYSEAYGKAYNEVIEKDGGFSILKEGETIPEGEATLEPYTEIAKAQIQAYNTSKDDETLDLKEYIMGELNQYSKHFDGIDLDEIEKEVDTFMEQYKKDPAKIEQNETTEMFMKVANVHDFYDLNGDGVLEQDEIAQYYHILDISDNEEGKQDGKIEFNSYAYWDGISSTESEERTEIKNDFTSQYKIKHPEKFSQTI